MIAAFDHPFLSGLLGDEEMATRLGVESEIAAMLRFEIALAEVEGDLGIIPAEAAKAIANILGEFRPEMAGLRAGTEHDGVVVPELVRQIRHAVGQPHGVHAHFGATSQDVIDTAMMLRAKACIALLHGRLDALVTGLDAVEQRFGDRPLMGRTRMQAAVPIAVSDRLASWRGPLLRHIERADAVRISVLAVQFGGAAGTLEKFGRHGPEVRAALARRLGLGDAPQWQSQRDRMAELANWLALVTGSLGKLGQDIALMAQAGDEIQLDGGGASSAMAHKRNPVDAEVLVTLARFNAVQLSGMHQALVHEQERSGAAWTLEWMILPQMFMAAGSSTRIADRLVRNIRAIGVQAT